MNPKEKRYIAVTLGPIISILIITVASLLISSIVISKMSLGTATSLLAYTIQIDGILFGSTAIAYGLLCSRKTFSSDDARLAFSRTTAFLCYLFSLAFAFLLMGNESTDGLVLGPAFIAAIGGLFSALMVGSNLQQKAPLNEKEQ